MQPTKIAILGSAPSSKMLAPFNDPAWTIWACSVANMGHLPRVDVWFELHSLDRRQRESPGYLEQLAKQPLVWMQEQYPGYPGSQKYPLEEIKAKFGPERCKRWLTSSPSYMMAMAIHHLAPEYKPGEYAGFGSAPEGVKIGIWGVDMATPDERGHQKPGCHWWLEQAENAGIPVFVPPEADLLQASPLYGYRENDPMWRKLNVRRKELKQRINNAQSKQDQGSVEENMLSGALEDCEYVMETWA